MLPLRILSTAAILVAFAGCATTPGTGSVDAGCSGGTCDNSAPNADAGCQGGACDDTGAQPDSRHPFYVVGHNPNTIALATAALESGANAIEPDINIYSDGSGLCVSHDEGHQSAPSLETYLTDLHEISIAHPELALVVFLGPNVRPSIERATELRAETGRPRFIYGWTVNDDELQREYMRIGLDGLISDDVAALRMKLDEPEFRARVRLAKRGDNPFAPNNAYGLTLHTGDVANAGTDAKISFTLTGTLGSAASRSTRATPAVTSATARTT